MYKINRPDIEIKEGNITTYIDQEELNLEELKCPCCSKDLEYSENSKTVGQGTSENVMKFSCSDCHLTFKGIEDRHQFVNFVEFYNFVKSRLNHA